MNALPRGVQHGAAALVLGLVLAAGARADDAPAPELVAARELFRQGTEDVDAGRYAQALEKFRRVGAVKETANVRFNIARCEESLGKTGAALADFELAEREGKGGGQQPDDVAKLAHDRADALRPRVPRLGLTAPSPPPAGMTVTLDGAKLAIAALGVPLPVDPGPHVIDATAPGREPFHTEVTLIESESKTVAIGIAPGDATPPPPPPPPEAPAEGSSARRTWGIVALAAGGALGAGSLAFLLLHNGVVSSVESACPGDRCPASSQASVTSNESSARTDETLSVVFVGAAAVSAGVGLFLVLGDAPHATATAVLSPGAPGSPAGLTLRGSF